MDGDNNKPFVCTSPGCGMRFTNEDHLTVHLKKHEMSLILNYVDGANEARTGGGAAGGHNNMSNNSTLFVDQTPTPTRFIRNCEEVGLFQDLQNVNPFEDHFRKAVEATKIGNSLPTVEPLRVSADSDILHTPSVLAGDLEVVNQLVDDNCSAENSALDIPVSHVETNDNVILCESVADSVTDDEVIVISTSAPPPNSNSAVTAQSSVAIEEDVPATSSYNGEDEHLSILPTTDSSAVSSSTVTYTFSSSSQFSSKTTLDTDSADQDVDIIKQIPTNVLPTDVGSVVQFILRLPDGSSLPVSLPSMPIVVAPTATDSPAMQAVSTSLAKQILKNTLTGGHMATTSGLTKTVVERQIGSPSFMNFDSTSNDSDSPDKQLSERKRNYGGREHSDEKRMKFLERNRAAATRCRQKRKQWVQTLESKADELNSVNHQLQNEVTSLRNEVAQLKSMLLAHKDCPVTLQQKAQLGQQLNGLCGTPATILIHKDDNLEVIQIGSSDTIASSNSRTQHLVHLVGLANAGAAVESSTVTATATPVIVRKLAAAASSPSSSSSGMMTQTRKPQVLLAKQCSVQSKASADPVALTLPNASSSDKNDTHIVITVEDEHLM